MYSLVCFNASNTAFAVKGFCLQLS